MIRTACITAASFATAAVVVVVLYLLAWLAPPLQPLTSKDQVSFVLFWGLHCLVVLGSVGAGALSQPAESTAKESRRRALDSKTVALLLTPGFWTVAYLIAPAVTGATMPQWQRRFAGGEELFATPLTMLPLSAGAVYAGQVWRRTGNWWACAGSVVGGPLAYLGVSIAEAAHSDVAALIGVLLWPASALITARLVSRRSSAHPSGAKRVSE
jgi:hypothetical protein